MSSPRSRGFRRLGGAAVAVLGLVVAGCSDGGDTVSVPDDGGSTSTTVDPSEAPGAGTEYCDEAASAVAAPGGLDMTADAESVLASIRSLDAVAPADLRDDYATFLGGIEGIAELDEDDPRALTGILELMTDPEFESAARGIESGTLELCGIQLGATTGSVPQD